MLTTFERYGEWQDATFVSATPPGPLQKGQRIELSAGGLGRRWPVSIDVDDIDPNSRWIDLRIHTPFGIVNHEHATLTATDTGGTLIRLN